MAMNRPQLMRANLKTNIPKMFGYIMLHLYSVYIYIYIYGHVRVIGRDKIVPYVNES